MSYNTIQTIPVSTQSSLAVRVIDTDDLVTLHLQGWTEVVESRGEGGSASRWIRRWRRSSGAATSWIWRRTDRRMTSTSARATFIG